MPVRPHLRDLPGLDVSRLAAIVLVTSQHALTISGHDRWTMLGPVNIGQLGVGLFLAISGFLATQGTTSPTMWLANRLRRVFPTYWVVMLFSFTVVTVTHYKRFTALQFFSQMAGTGLFTHPEDLVNVPTWFISILLLCYLLMFCVIMTKRPAMGCAAIAAAISLGAAFGLLQWPWAHLLTFLSYGIAGARAERRRLLVIVGAAIALAFMAHSIWFFYTGASGIALFVVLRFARVPNLIRLAAACSYEYYLVHGMCLLAAFALMPLRPLAATVLGISAAAVLAWLLARGRDWLTQPTNVVLAASMRL